MKMVAIQARVFEMNSWPAVAYQWVHNIKAVPSYFVYSVISIWRHDTQHYDTQRNNTQHTNMKNTTIGIDDTQHNTIGSYAGCHCSERRYARCLVFQCYAEFRLAEYCGSSLFNIHISVVSQSVCQNKKLPPLSNIYYLISVT